MKVLKRRVLIFFSGRRKPFLIAHNDTTTCIQYQCRGNKSSLCYLQDKKNAHKFASYQDQVVAKDFEVYKNYACLELSCFAPMNSNSKKEELKYMTQLIKAFGIMYSFDLKSDYLKIKISALSLEFKTNLNHRPIVNIAKNAFVEVVKEEITPKLNELSQFISTVNENVVDSVRATGILEGIVTDGNVSMATELKLVHKKLDKLLSFTCDVMRGKTSFTTNEKLTVALAIENHLKETKIQKPDPSLVCCLCEYAGVSDTDLSDHIDFIHVELFNLSEEIATPGTSTNTKKLKKRSMPSCSNVLPSAKKPNCDYYDVDFESKELVKVDI